jgi:hypothetical protein
VLISGTIVYKSNFLHKFLACFNQSCVFAKHAQLRNCNYKETNKISVKNMNLSDEVLLEDSPEICISSSTRSDFKFTIYEVERQVYQMLRDVFQLESPKKFKNCE